MLAAALQLIALTSVPAVTPTPADFHRSRQWSDSLFNANGQVSPRSSIRVVEEDSPDAITRGRSWRGTPFQIATKTYPHGLAFNSNKRLAIHLDRPAKRFRSDIGLENNDDTRNGAGKKLGSVIFLVRVNGQEVLTSPVMRLEDAPRSVDIPLDGAQDFEIGVADAGDGRGYDQALWAEAEIELSDGSRLRLQDLLPESKTPDPNPARFSFLFDGKPSRDFLKNWERKVSASPLPGGGGELREVTLRDPQTGMQAHVSAKVFADFPAVEWVVRFKNTGSQDSPLLENIQALDSLFELPASASPTLHWAKGGVSTFDDFAPQTVEMKAGAKFALQPNDGRSSSEILPFFNLEGTNSGVVLAVGWSGRWAAQFQSDQLGAVQIQAGMAKTHLVLHPGEEIRTPSMLALFYEGDRWRGQNLLRQFILKYHRPQRNGKPLQAPITCGNWGGTTAEVHEDNIRKFIEHRLPIEYYWIDAGWYGKPEVKEAEDWSINVGRWDVKPSLYPKGFKPLSDLLRSDKRELMVWFEPERVFKGTPWHRKFAGKWLLEDGGDNSLMNMGNPEARKFVTDFISDRIKEFGLGCYRQDYNIDPAPFWQKNDTPDRQGMTEIRYIEGLYAFWDGLLERDPNLIIDNCASGGRRIDLETVGRATPFWRTDGPRDAIAHQCHSYGLLAWVPLSAISQDREGDSYEFRSSMCSSLCINWNHSGDGPTQKLPDNFPFDWARKTLDQYVGIRDFYYGDYYPLTPYTQAPDQWMAYQFDTPDKNQGLVVALRRPQSRYEVARLPLHALDPAATYQVTDLDSNKVTKATGQELLEQGLRVSLSEKPGSALLIYRKQ
jgi:alpha-galactosidase